MKTKQNGVISLTWMSYLFSISVIVLCAVKVVPIYVENMYVKEALQFIVDNNSDLRELNKKAITNQIGKYASINSLSVEQKDSFTVHKNKEGYIVNSVYEVRAPLIYNVEVVVSFKQQLDTANPDACCDYIVDMPTAKKK